MRYLLRVSLFCIAAVLLLGCPSVLGKRKQDPVAEEKKALEELKALAVRDMSSGEGAAEARGLVYLALEGQARLFLYTQAHPTEIDTLSPEAVTLRIDIGRYLSTMRQRKYHLTPSTLSLKLQGVTPLGAELNRAAIDLLMPTGNPSTQPGAISGQVNMLKLFYNGAAPLDVTTITPPPAERGQISAYGVEVWSAMLEILAAPNVAAIAAYKPQSIKQFKRQAKATKKKLSAFVKK